MGISNKSKHNASRRQFGKAGGRHGRMAKKREKASLLKQEERVIWYDRNKQSNHPPYQLIRRPSSGTKRTMIVVRRVPFYRDHSSKLVRLGSTSLKFKYVKCSKPVTGYRIMNVELLQQHIVSITTHTCVCLKAQELVKNGKDPVTLKTEIRKNGLFSILLVVCQGCRKEFPLKNSEKQRTGLIDINVRAVWGSVTAGGGSSKLNESLTAMNIPPMNEGCFTSIEDKIGTWWQDALKEEMLKAGAEERRRAIEAGNFHEGIPAITVICDGGWSKRTHKHTYNASGGVAVIFGAATQKLLYIGVRNKQCIICKVAHNAQTTPRTHNCFSNWKDSSQAMESDIILNGFLEAESTHGLRYTKIIADGDSSVFCTLQEKIPVWGRSIQKLECANHTCKCIRSNLEKLVQEKPYYKGKGKLTKMNRIRLSTAIRCAIKMRSKDNNSKLLRSDILNSVYHIFGFHEHCSEFCTKKATGIPSSKDSCDSSTPPESDESFDDIFDSQAEMWRQPTASEMEDTRKALSPSFSSSELRPLIKDVQIILNRVADKSHRLIGNFTTNLAESWMSIRAKFDGGKVINRCGRGSWATRCYGGALRKNLGVEWSPLTFQNTTGTPAGTHFMQGARRQLQKLNASKKYHSKATSKALRSKRKCQTSQESSTKKARLAYGSNLDDSDDVTNEKLQELCNNFMNKNVNRPICDINNIEKGTIDQHQSELWKKERHLRLTSSNFGKVIKRRTTNISTALVKTILYNKFKGNIHTVRGLAQEANTIIEYRNIKGDVQVLNTGLRISEEHPFLAASTDGIVKEKNGTGLLEIKNFLQTNTHLIKEAALKLPNFCLQLNKNILRLKKNHEIYYQIQGQLNIFDKEWCDFVLRRSDPYDIYIERIYVDKTLWNESMLPKLKCFYFKFILPELSLPRFGTYTGIRSPTSPWFDPEIDIYIPVKKGQVTKNPREKGQVTKKPDTPFTKPVASTSTSIQPSVLPGVSHQQNLSPKPSVLPVPSQPRPRRSNKVKFVGRNIKHEWIVDEDSGKTEWYTGRVLQAIKGKDGDVNTVYEIQYEGEDEAHEVDNLKGDLEDGSLKFIDV